MFFFFCRAATRYIYSASTNRYSNISLQSRIFSVFHFVKHTINFGMQYKTNDFILKGCLHNADVVFMVDSSTSVGSENFQKTQNALKNIITNMDIGHNKVQVGVMQYSSYPMMGFPLKLYGNRGDVLHAVENLHMTSGGTNTADAIKFTTDEMFSATSGARSNVPRIAILLTNGGTVDSQAAINAANVARQAGIGINVVAVGNSVNQQEIQAIANQPAGSHVVTVNNFDQLEQQATNILNQACAGEYSNKSNVFLHLFYNII